VGPNGEACHLSKEFSILGEHRWLIAKKTKKKKRGAGLVRHPKINMKQNKYPQLYTEGVE
jgi:hypothetical protein